MGKYCLLLFADDVESGFKGTSLIRQPSTSFTHGQSWHDLGAQICLFLHQQLPAASAV